MIKMIIAGKQYLFKDEETRKVIDVAYDVENAVKLMKKYKATGSFTSKKKGA